MSSIVDPTLRNKPKRFQLAYYSVWGGYCHRLLRPLPDAPLPIIPTALSRPCHFKSE